MKKGNLLKQESAASATRRFQSVHFANGNRRNSLCSNNMNFFDRYTLRPGNREASVPVFASLPPCFLASRTTPNLSTED